MEGYIKLWRKFEKWEWYSDSKMVHLFIFMMLRATHDTTKFKGYTLKRGQMIFGYKTASIATGISPQSLRSCIKRLISTGELTRQVTHDFSIITIVNYDSYQKRDTPSNNQINSPTNNQSTSHQQAINNIQECKEHKNTVVPTATREVFDHFRARFKTFRGVDLVSVWGKDMKTFKELLSQVDKDALKSMIDEFFKSKDQFVLSSDYGVGVFRSQINKLNKPKKTSIWDMPAS